VPVETNPQPWSVRRLNKLAEAIEARTYLEIGIARGDTLLGVSVAHRTGVDRVLVPRVRDQDSAGIALYEMTSDEYFGSLPSTTTIDLAYIDGLHTFEQAYRDLCNALAHATARTVVLMDDTWPDDEFSAIPDLGLSQRSREAAGSTGNSWHGDVYKVVATIHDFHGYLSYATIIGSGNPQTLIWRGHPQHRVPLFAGMADIAQLSYERLVADPSFLRPTEETAAIEQCLADVRESPP